MTKNILETMIFCELWENFSKYKELKLKKESYRKIANNFKNHILPYFKDMKVIDITADDVVDWMTSIEKKGYKNSYNASLYECLVLILNYAMDFYDLEKNVASKVGGFNKAKKNETKNVDFWTLEEFNKFIEVVDSPIYKLLYETLFYTGLRLGECLALNWNDYKNGYFYINKTLLKEKFSEDSYTFNSPKTPQSIRTVLLDDDLVKKLNDLKAKQQKEKDFSENWFIFGGRKPLSQTTVSRKKDGYCDISGVKKIRMHDFRHSHATLMLSSGVPVTCISKRLGHKDIAMTLNTYSHYIPQDEKILIEKINNMKV